MYFDLRRYSLDILFFIKTMTYRNIEIRNGVYGEGWQEHPRKKIFQRNN
jgi:hypothetical protein